MTDLLESLKKSDLQCSSEALSDFEQFEVEFSTKATLCDELLSIYKGRAVHLEKYDSVHAKQLQLSTKEFCDNLENNLGKKCFFYTLKGKPKHDYNLIVLSETNELLGCLKTISKLKVTDEEWSQVWS